MRLCLEDLKGNSCRPPIIPVERALSVEGCIFDKTVSRALPRCGRGNRKQESEEKTLSEDSAEVHNGKIGDGIYLFKEGEIYDANPGDTWMLGV